MYAIEVRHPGLHKFRVIRGIDERIVQEKAQAQVAAWNEAWARKVEIANRQAERAAARADAEAQKQEAADRTAEAKAAIEALSLTLARALETDPALNWDALKILGTFDEQAPTPPAARQFLREPQQGDEEYRVRFTLWDHIASLFADTWKDRQRARARGRFEEVHKRWESAKRDFDARRAEEARQFTEATVGWESRRSSYIARQTEQNGEIDRLRAAYGRGEPDAIQYYCDAVLEQSDYPGEFPQSYDLEYVPAAKRLILDYTLPAPEDLPRVKSVAFTKGELVERPLSEREMCPRPKHLPCEGVK